MRNHDNTASKCSHTLSFFVSGANSAVFIAQKFWEAKQKPSNFPTLKFIQRFPLRLKTLKNRQSCFRLASRAQKTWQEHTKPFQNVVSCAVWKLCKWSKDEKLYCFEFWSRFVQKFAKNLLLLLKNSYFTAASKILQKDKRMFESM